MGAIGGLLGTSGGANGTGFAGPAAANLVNPVNSAQTGAAYTGSQNALTAQQGLLTALQAQNGLANQGNVYNQLQGVVNGTGPNPAQTMLNTATGQNVANTAALQAGQRGGSANTGLMARQIGQQGAATQQAAVGQGATLQANQSLNALSAAGNMANTQVANQVGQTNANSSAQQAEQAALLNAQSNFNSAQAGMQSNINSANASMAGATMGMTGSLIGGLAGGAAAGMMLAAKGGNVKKMASGGITDSSAFSGTGPQSKFGQFLAANTTAAGVQNSSIDMSGASAGNKSMNDAAYKFGKALTSGSSEAPTTVGQATDWQVGGGMAGGPMDAGSAASQFLQAARGGRVKALVSPGEKYLTPKDVEKVKKGANPMKVGETIKGKPKVGGAVNSYANDTVRKDLQEGGIIVPRSETKSKNPDRSSKAFVQATLAKRKRG